MKEYYAIYDKQLNEIKQLALNETSLTKIRECLITFLTDSGEFSEEGEESLQQESLTELLANYDFALLKSENIITKELENFENLIV